MIIGIGVDICNVERLAGLRQKYGARFIDRVFSPAERERCGDGPACDERFAARFAAKEAVMKALGTGWGQGISFANIEVRTEESGRPVVSLSGGAGRLAEQKGVTHIHVSLSHERDNAIAFVILEA